MMKREKSNRLILRLALPLMVLLAASSSWGIFIKDFYAAETYNWQVQSRGQDWIDLLLITPAFIVTSILAYRENKAALLVWGGVVLYLIYTFTIFSFSVHFNSMFVVYCVILGLSFYAFIYFVYVILKSDYINDRLISNSLSKAMGIYFISVSCIFYLLWLSEVIPAMINNDTPQTIIDASLPTNPVHVLDLAVVLPGIFVTGFQVLKRRSIGFVLAPVVLTFFILMDLTIAMLIVMMVAKGFEGSMIVAGVMTVLALVSAWLLVGYFRSLRNVSSRIINLADYRSLL